MTENEIRKLLIDKGLKQSDIARRMAGDFGLAYQSARVSVNHLITGARWFPKYADWLKKNYGIVIDKPDWAKPVRERLRAAA
ncbi:MAG: hypothetical protein KIS76_03955 [Pyrinomonadaceae bacterium]|nr:hypothetical protein [Pyrinomonadaceae bacterium]